MPEGKLITILQHRREIDAALEGLVRSRTEEEGYSHVLALSAYGAASLPVLMNHLDTPDPWVVRALGRVLAQMGPPDRKQAGAMLRQSILDPDSSDRRRIVAMVLLDQFLEEPLDDALFVALGNPTEVAVRALLKERPAEEHIVCLDYLSIIQAQPSAEIRYAIEEFRQAASPLAMGALRFLALDERDTLAQQAIEALGTIFDPHALQALQVLEPNVPDARRPLVERAQRKLLLSGVVALPAPTPPSGTRVLLSPMDGAGNRLILVLFPVAGGYRVLHIFLDDEQGIRGTYELILPARDLPEAAPPGTVLPAPHPWEGIFLLEAGFPYVRRLLRQALDYNQMQRSLPPLEYRFFCDQIWLWSAPPEDELDLPSTHRPVEQKEVSALLGHAFLASWFIERAAVQEAAQKLLTVDFSQPEGQGLLALVTVSLVQSEFSALVCLRYSQRLRDTAEWLLRAGYKNLARVAIESAEELDSVEALRSIFALVLMQKSLLIAVEQARRERLDDGP
ncbi:MAG: HEAT repeat domain-containing protein [Chloroflexia bacterium]|nr:HEAT repeat domain-containing protein [Chloroflexia bacterium]